MGVYGYARVSTSKQKLNRQIENIKSIYPEAIIVTEKYTGTTSNRPEWNKLKTRLQKGDLIIFDEVSRMSRNANEGFSDYQMLFEKGIKLVFLKEPHINTEAFKNSLIKSNIDSNSRIMSAVQNLLMAIIEEQIAIAFRSSEKEVEMLRKRVKEGIGRAKVDGKQIGRRNGSKVESKKSIGAKEKIRKLSKEFGGSNTDIEVIKILGISRNTYYKYKKELRGLA